MGRRIRWMGVVLILCFSLVLLQLYNIQFRKASALANSPNNPRNVAKHLDNDRGLILAADGTVLAQSVKVSNSLIDYHYQREYPQGSLYSQIVGYDSYTYGLDGVERQYNSYLVPHSRSATNFEQLLHPETTTDAVTLTVNPALQKLAQEQLAGRDGAVVVLNPTTGAVEAMYSNPTYDPTPLASNNSREEQLAWLALNAPDGEGQSAANPIATQQTFAPGSTFKVVTTSAAYDFKPQLTTKSYPVVVSTPLPNSNQLLHNDGNTPCGGTVTQMLPESCDPGYGLLGIDLGGPTLALQASRFGFNKVPPIDLPGTVASSFPTAVVVNPRNAAYLAYSAIGQYNDRATPLQMALVAAGIADGGVVMTPHVMSQIHDAAGNLVTSYQPTPWLRATTQKTAQEVTPLMEAVVTSGTASGVGFPPQDQVAAKTGTAQTGNSANNTHDWMIAFAPASDPQVAVAVVVPFQPYSAYGATVAGPIVKAMIEAALAQPGSATATTTTTTKPGG